jgi:hypothetical protein
MKLSSKEQYHFVVRYDQETNSFEMDYDTQDSVFAQGPVYDTVINTWARIGDRIDDNDSAYNRAADAIFWAISALRLQGETNDITN